MATFSQIEIDYLITCPKRVLESPSRSLRLLNASWRNDAKLIASDGTKGTFSVFMRRNDDLPENFSIGLMYSSNDGRPEIILLRCNGKHGAFTGSGDVTHPHYDFHIHLASESAMEAGFRPEKYAVKTNEYASYKQAVQYFVKRINLEPGDARKHFPDSTQGLLFMN